MIKLLTSKIFTSVGLLLFATLLVTSCKEDEPAPDPIASFQYEISETNYLEVTFTNFSQNAESVSWDFGDGTSSTDEIPVKTYAAEGTYTVTLTAINADGVEHTKDDPIIISDPDKERKKLTGETSKEWKLIREGNALALGPDAGDPAAYFNLQNDGSRPCLFYQTFTFHFDGTFVYDDKGMFWGENDPFDGTANHEICFEPTAANMVNKDGADVSAWGSGTHAFEYNTSESKVTLNGTGAWIGFVHIVGNNTYSNIPTATRTFDVTITEETGYDVLTVIYAYDDLYWTATYVSYSDPSLEPDVVEEQEEFCVDLDDISPDVMSHSFATAEDFVVLGTVSDGTTTVDFGVDDPTDAGAPKVGQFNRTADQFQELQFRTSPDLKDVDFANITSISLDVYLPSSNDYSGSLTKFVEIGIADQSCIEQWWTDIYKYNSAELATDTWVTLQFDVDTPSSVATAGTTPLTRDGLDMIYINIGGTNHNNTGTFFVRNFVIE